MLLHNGNTIGNTSDHIYGHICEHKYGIEYISNTLCKQDRQEG